MIDETLKADVEALVNLVEVELNGAIEDNSLADWYDSALKLITRIKNNLAEPTDDNHIRENHSINRNPFSNREDR